MSEEDIKYVKSGCLAIFVIFVLGFLFFSIQIVNPGQAAVVSRFGKLDETTRTPGLYLEPLATVTYYDTKTVPFGSTLAAATRDLQDVKIDVILNYELDSTKLTKIYSTIGDKERVEQGIIAPELAGIGKSITTKYSAEELLQKREQVKNEIEEKLTAELIKRDIRVVGFNLTNLAFSDEFNKAIDAKQIAEQNALKSKFDLETAKTQGQIQQAQAQSLTDAYLRKLYLEKWDGHLPQTLVTDGNSSIILPTK